MYYLSLFPIPRQKEITFEWLVALNSIKSFETNVEGKKPNESNLNSTSSDLPTGGHCPTSYYSNQYSTSVGHCAEEADCDLSFFTEVSSRKKVLLTLGFIGNRRQS